MTQLSLFSVRHPETRPASSKPPRPPKPASWMDNVGPEDYGLQAKMRYVLNFWTPKSEEEWLAWAPHLTGPLPDRWARYRDSFAEG